MEGVIIVVDSAKVEEVLDVLKLDRQAGIVPIALTDTTLRVDAILIKRQHSPMLPE
jgi:hypothetical protein